MDQLCMTNSLRAWFERDQTVKFISNATKKIQAVFLHQIAFL